MVISRGKMSMRIVITAVTKLGSYKAVWQKELV